MRSQTTAILTIAIAGGLFLSTANAGLIGHYKLDDGSGLTAIDSAPGALHGTLTGENNGGTGNGTGDGVFNNPSWVPGLSGGAVRFGDKYNGSSSTPGQKIDDVIQVGSKVGSSNPEPGKSGPGTKFDITGALTISAWVNLSADFADGHNSTRHIAGKDHSNGATDDGYGLQHRMSGSDDTIRFIIGEHDGIGGWADAAIESTSKLSDMKLASSNGGWVHLVGVFDPTLPSASRMKLYVDGALDVTATQVSEGLDAGVPTSIASSNTEFTIGRLGGDNPAAWRYSFYGDIDDVQLYNMALSDTDVAFLYNNIGAAIPEPTTCSLLFLGVSSVLTQCRRRR